MLHLHLVPRHMFIWLLKRLIETALYDNPAGRLSKFWESECLLVNSVLIVGYSNLSFLCFEDYTLLGEVWKLLPHRKGWGCLYTYKYWPLSLKSTVAWGQGFQAGLCLKEYHGHFLIQDTMSVGHVRQECSRLNHVRGHWIQFLTETKKKAVL